VASAVEPPVGFVLGFVFHRNVRRVAYYDMITLDKYLPQNLPVLRGVDGVHLEQLALLSERHSFALKTRPATEQEAVSRRQVNLPPGGLLQPLNVVAFMDGEGD
jgi:hypothetical protein